MEKIYSFKNAILINLLFLIFRVIYIAFYPIDLDPEEAQYWDWSRHIDFSYYSKPPLVAYLNFLSTHLFGNTIFAIKFWPILFSFLEFLIIYKFSLKLYKDKRVAFLSSTLPNFTSGFNINSILMTTDAPFLFYWAICLAVIWELFEKKKTKDFIYTGIFSAIDFLSKYTAVFLLPFGIIYAFLYDKKLLKDKRLLLSLTLGVLIPLQVIIWNFCHHFDSFKHVATLAGIIDPQTRFKQVLNFIGSQIGLLSVSFFFLIIYSYYKAFKKRTKEDMFLVIFSLPVFIFFLILSFNAGVQGNWSDFGYIGALILGAKYFPKNKFISVFTIIFGFLITILIMFTPILDIIGLSKVLKPEHDPTKFLIGWKALGKEVSKIYKPGDLVFSNFYQISAELAFYTKNNPEVFCINLGRRKNEYDLWKKDMKNYIGKDGIYVSVWKIDKRVLKGFKKIIYQEKFNIYWRGKVVNTFYIYLLKDYNGHIIEDKTNSY